MQIPPNRRAFQLFSSPCVPSWYWKSLSQCRFTCLRQPDRVETPADWKPVYGRMVAIHDDDDDGDDDGDDGDDNGDDVGDDDEGFLCGKKCIL